MRSLSGRTAIMALVLTWICSAVGLASDSESKPKNVVIKLPKAKESLQSKSSFQIEGQIKVVSGRKEPEVVLIRILRQGSPKTQVGSWAIRLGEDEADSSFKSDDEGYLFNLKVSAPEWPGKYSIDATSITPGKDAAGKVKNVEEKSDPLEISIVK